MKEAQIRTISDYTADRLRAQTDTACSVHSVYERTANLLLRDGSLCALQKTGSPFSPLTLFLPENDALLVPGALSPGDSVLPVLSADTEYIETGIPPAFSGSGEMRACLEAGMRILAGNRSGGFSPLLTMPDDYDFSNDETIPFRDALVLNAAGLCLKKARAMYRADDEGSYRSTAEELSRLIGIGGGLTPSGDDFLCGILTALHAAGETVAPFRHCLTQTLLPLLDRTHPVSAAFVRCAADGQTSLPFVHFLALADGTAEAQEGSVAKEIHAVGHSSGMDTLSGIVFALSVFL